MHKHDGNSFKMSKLNYLAWLELLALATIRSENHVFKLT